MNRFRLATFRVMSPDEPTGGVALADEVDPLEALIDEGNLDLSDGGEVRLPGDEEPNEDPDGDPDAKPDDAGGDPDPDPAALPESIDVDGTPVPVSELLDAYRENQGNAELLAHGETYAGTIEVFNSGPDGARQVIEAMITAAKEEYGDDAVAGLGAPDALPDGFKEEDLTENELALYQRLRATERKLETQTKTFQQALDELKPLATEKKLQEAGDAYATTVNAQFPNANVDAKTIVAMMKETGLDDPVKAYKLSTYDTKAADAAAGKATETKPKNTMPRPGSSEKTFDPQDPSLTADRIVWLMEHGYKPIGAKP